MISTVITTSNESDKLASCLESLSGFSDEIIIVDLGSSDGLDTVAHKFNAKIVSHSKVLYVELVRNFGIQKAEGDWILILDPDEKLSNDLKEKLKEISSQEKYIAVNIPRKNIFFGKWIKHTNWWPDKHIRFFKKEKVSWSKRIHSYPNVDGEILNLDAKENLAIIHKGYEKISEFFERQNRYSTIESKNRFDSGERFSWWKLVLLAKREFLARYIKHLGFMDGFYGFVLVYMMMIYQISVWIKVWEIEKKANIK